MASDQAQLVRRLRNQGFSVQRGGKHYKVRRPDQAKFVTMPATPSDHRSIANTIATLKTIGYDPNAEDDKTLNHSVAIRREQALTAAREHNEHIDDLAVTYSGPAEGAQYRDMTARALGRIVMTDRTEQRLPNRILSGQACSECKQPFEKCLKNPKGRNRACCGPCSSYDTHEEQVVKELHLFEPYEGEGDCRESIRFARSWIRQGYHVQNVMRRTGVGFKWLEDLVGLDGYAKQ